MKKIFFLLILNVNVIVTFSQSNISESNSTTIDALYFLNKIFKSEQGQTQINITSNKSLFIRITKSNIDTLFVTSDSTLIIKETVNDVVTYHGKTTKDHYWTQFRIPLKEVSFVKFRKDATPLTKTEFDEYCNCYKTIERVLDYTDFYEILPLRNGAITAIVSDGQEIVMPAYRIEMTISLKDKTKKEFNDLLTRISKAFNFLIKAHGGGQSSNEKTDDEKF